MTDTPDNIREAAHAVFMSILGKGGNKTVDAITKGMLDVSRSARKKALDEAAEIARTFNPSDEASFPEIAIAAEILKLGES